MFVAEGGATVVNPIDEQKFILEQFHFHFGCADDSGSEHTVDGKAYAAEVSQLSLTTQNPSSFNLRPSDL